MDSATLPANSLAFRVSTVTARIATRCVFELTAAFGALTDHCRHLGRASGFHSCTLHDLPFRGRNVFQTTINKQQTLRHSLFWRSEQPLVKPNGVGAGHFVKAAGDLVHFKSAPKHFGR